MTPEPLTFSSVPERPQRLPAQLGDERNYGYAVQLEFLLSLASDDPADPMFESEQMRHKALAEHLVYFLESISQIQLTRPQVTALASALVSWDMTTFSLVEDGRPL